jgi:hypothetical protein
MPGQTEHGKAFEYACLKGLDTIIRKYGQGISSQIISNDTYCTAKQFFDTLPDIEHKNLLLSAGEKMVMKLKELEPRLIYPVQGFSDTIRLEIQPDEKGVHGDVRDVLALRILLESERIGWEIGISCKHNHKAVKHPRISPHINIGKEWVDVPSDIQYFDDIKPVFEIINESIKAGVLTWSEIKGKDELIYRPLMIAVKNQILRLFKSEGPKFCENLLSYLIGKNDFYKVIIENTKNIISIQGFNFHNSLSLSAGTIHASNKVKLLKLPSQIHDIDFKNNSNSTLLIVMDQGWTISMRIHSAKTNLEKSLKLDVQLIGVPQEFYKESLAIV